MSMFCWSTCGPDASCYDALWMRTGISKGDILSLDVIFHVFFCLFAVLVALRASTFHMASKNVDLSGPRLSFWDGLLVGVLGLQLLSMSSPC